MNTKQNSERIPLDISQAPWVECEQGNKLFKTKLLFKRISSFISPTGKEENVPLDVVICDKCGKVPKFFFDKAPDIPEELKSTCSE